MHGARPSPRHLRLYKLALICQAFSAYTIEAAESASADVLAAAELLSIARQVNAS